ncbi:MAG: thioredoxin domain-containing protein [Acidimicrobiia bacterium]
MANRLSRSTSPYLLQHANNPVDWFEWGEEAMVEARTRDVPILLSVGYSACHWCHVMAHESFEDPDTAAEMNRLFVNVKVDREERPDVDSVYMEAVQAMTGHGGWPMTVWLTPDGEPFFAGTYFPQIDRAGMPSFRKVMAAVADAWNGRRSEVAEQAARVTNALTAELPASSRLPGVETLAMAHDALLTAYDPVHGGFGSAPKFPQAPTLEYLLRSWEQPWAPAARRMLRQTLLRMSRGGIHDHLGGGFARYSVDERWLVPHFEKMLYDNAQLARIFLWAGTEFGESGFVEVARSTLDYLLTDLVHEDGGFFAAEDADSEGVEGKFYVWDYDEFARVTGDDAVIAVARFGVSRDGNFEGHNILTAERSVAELAEETGFPAARVKAAIERSTSALLTHRSSRVRPGLDDKVVAAWNGLAIRAMAEAGAVLKEPLYVEAARRAARFVLERMRDPDGTLLRAWAQGRAGDVGGFLDDYAAMGVGLLSLYAVTGESVWFERAAELINEIPGRFGDGDDGLFSTFADQLIKRPRDLFDNPSPSGTALAAEATLLLSLYTGDLTLRTQAEGYLRSVGPIMERYPSAAGHALGVLASMNRETRELAVIGDRWAELAAPYWDRYRPHVALAAASRPNGSIALLEGRGAPDRTLAYLCTGFLCLAPVESVSELAGLLDST